MTKEQARYVYKKTESGEIINTETLCQETEQEKQLNRIDNTSEETNPYKELIVNNAEKDRTIIDTNGTVVYPEQYVQLYTI